MSDIQRALDRQAQLEREATVGPWHISSEVDIETGLDNDDRYYEWLGEITAKHEDETEYLSLLIQSCGLYRFAKPNADLIAHLRNQAALARAVIEAAAPLLLYEDDSLLRAERFRSKRPSSLGRPCERETKGNL
jgi:hypothetical protein